MDEQSFIETVVTTVIAAFLALLGWHGRKVAEDVDDLTERTVRLEATAVDLEDIRKVLREEVGIHIRDGDRRIGQVEKQVEKVFDRLNEMQGQMAKRATDRRVSDEPG